MAKNIVTFDDLLEKNPISSESKRASGKKPQSLKEILQPLSEDDRMDLLTRAKAKGFEEIEQYRNIFDEFIETIEEFAMLPDEFPEILKQATRIYIDGIAEKILRSEDIEGIPEEAYDELRIKILTSIINKHF